MSHCERVPGKGLSGLPFYQLDPSRRVSGMRWKRHQGLRFWSPLLTLACGSVWFDPPLGIYTRAGVKEWSTQLPSRFLYIRESCVTEHSDVEGKGGQRVDPVLADPVPLVPGKGSTEPCQQARRRQKVSGPLRLYERHDNVLLPLIRIVQVPVGAHGPAEATDPPLAPWVAVRLSAKVPCTQLTAQVVLLPVQIHLWPLCCRM